MKGWDGLAAVALGVGLAAALGVAFATAPARAADPSGAAAVQPAAERPPVRVSADSAEYYNKENLVVFLGNVVATQSTSTLTADRMELIFSPAAAAKAPAGAGESPAATAAAATGGRQMKRLTALKNVTLRQLDAETKKERYATGEKAVYDTETQEVTMTGNPRLWEDRNVITGEEMVFHVDGQTVLFKGKVNLTVFPQEAGPEKKP